MAAAVTDGPPSPRNPTVTRRLSHGGSDGSLLATVRSALPDGWTLDRLEPGHASGDAVVLIEPTALLIRETLAAAGDTPVLLLRSSAIPERVDLDWLRPPRLATTRRARMRAGAARLESADIVAEAGPLCWPSGQDRADASEIPVVCDAVAPGAERQAMAQALGEDMVSAAETAARLHGLRLRAVPAGGLPGDALGTPVVLPAHARDLWQALASGAEVILCGPDDDPPDTCHAVPDAGRFEAVLRDIRDGVRRNGRDAVMAALAAESLFLALPASGTALAAEIRQELALVGRRLPRVTIVVNCYNYREYVRDAVLSACDQTDPADQILVVDDGSTDGSMDTVADIPGITILRKDNGGQASAFNLGLDRAEGDLVLFLDADDRLLPEAVERLRRAWRPGLSRMQFALETIDFAGHATGLYPDAAAMLSGDVTGRIAGWGNYPFMPTSGNIYAIEALRAVMPVPEEPWRLCADHYLNVLTPFEGEIASIPDVLGQYRVHGRNGHFHPFGDLAFRELHHLKYRVRVWRDVMTHLSRRGQPQDWLRSLQVHRRLLAAAADARTAAIVPWHWEALAALRLASGTGSAPGAWQRRAEHVAHALVSGLRRLWPTRLGGPATAPTPWPWPRQRRDETPLSSSSTWPLLKHGARIEAGTPAGRASWPGWGWRAGPRGEPLEAGAIAQLAFRLPLHPAHWMLRLDLARPFPGRLVADLNGHRLVDLGAPPSPCNILLPAELLAASEDARSCDITLRSPGKIPLRVTAMTVLAVPRGTGAAPLAVEGRWLDVAGRTAGAFALAGGWNWPTHGDVAAEGLQARLHLALPPDGKQWMLRFRCTHVGATAPILFVDGTRCPVFVSEDGRTLTAVWRPRRAIANPVFVDFVAPRGEALDLRLAAVRADRLRPGQAAFDEPREGEPGRGEGEQAGVPLPLPARLALEPPVPEVECRAVLLLVRDDDGGMPLLLTGGDLRAHVVPGLASAVRVPVVAGSGPSPVLAFGPGRRAVQLKSVTFVDAQPRAVPPRLGPGETLAGDDLSATALHAVDWMEPVEGALWLRGLTGSLALAIPRDASVRLEIDVLSLPGEGLQVSCEGIVAEATEPGPHTIGFTLRQGAVGRTVVTLRTRTLVPLPSPTPTSAMIGGAVTRVAVVPAEA